jgi:hypothetical protein
VPHRNRVTPTGEIVAAPHRGTLMGNRGVLHGDEGTIRRDFQVERWIACRLEFKGRHREILQPRRWTELFFLDEATAIAAGHRPCAECRRGAYRSWQEAWAAAHPGAPTNADAMDARLHEDRLQGRAKRTFSAPLDQLPTGTMVLHEGTPHLVLDGGLRRWTHAGYGEAARAATVTVLTPRAAVAVIAAGYAPALHPTAVPTVA